MALKLFKMDTIKISIEQYNKLLKIAYCTESFLDTNNQLTKQRLTNYIKEFNKQ